MLFLLPTAHIHTLQQRRMHPFCHSGNSYNLWERTVLVRVLQKNRTNRMLVLYTYLFSGIGSCEYRGWQVQSLQGGLAGWRLRGELMLKFKFEGSLLQNFLLFRGFPPSVLFRPLSDWMQPTYIMEGNLLYSKSTDLTVNLIPKHPHRNMQNNVWTHIWASWPSQSDT